MNGLTNTGSRSMILNVGPVELVLTILIAVMPPSPIVLPECDALALPFDSAECEALAANERRWQDGLVPNFGQIFLLQLVL